MSNYYLIVEVETNWWLTLKDGLTLVQAQNLAEAVQTERHKNLKIMVHDKRYGDCFVEDCPYGKSK